MSGFRGFGVSAFRTMRVESSAKCADWLELVQNDGVI